ADGILNVSAEDKGTGRKQSITITASTKMSDDEIEQKIREAELHADEDKKFKELTEAKNQAESLIYQTEKLMKENETVIGDLKDKILQKISDLRGAMESDDASRIKAAMEALQTALHEVSTRMYGQQPGAGSYPGGMGGQPGYQGDIPGGMGGTGTTYQARTEDEIEEEQFRKATGQDDNVVDAEYE
ncbi:MAG: Hsp70 family protein, partial [Candidatus Hermodarchaeota archaeon]